MDIMHFIFKQSLIYVYKIIISIRLICLPLENKPAQNYICIVNTFILKHMSQLLIYKKKNNNHK